MLKVLGEINNLSPKTVKEIEDKIKGFGDSVTYRFNISNPDLDPEAKEGAVRFNQVHNLSPRSFRILDKNKNEGSIFVTIQLIEETLINNLGTEYVSKFGKIKILEHQKGIVDYDLTKKENLEKVFYIECHPKLSEGIFCDKEKVSIIFRVNKAADAVSKIANREVRRKAETLASNMTDSQVVDFAQAMGWESKIDIKILRDKVENEAEINSVTFNDLVEGENIKFRSLVFKAKDKSIIKFDQSSFGFYWVGNEQPITILSPDGEESADNKFATWLMVSDAEQSIFKKIKSLVETR